MCDADNARVALPTAPQLLVLPAAAGQERGAFFASFLTCLPGAMTVERGRRRASSSCSTAHVMPTRRSTVETRNQPWQSLACTLGQRRPCMCTCSAAAPSEWRTCATVPGPRGRATGGQPSRELRAKPGDSRAGVRQSSHSTARGRKLQTRASPSPLPPPRRPLCRVRRVCANAQHAAANAEQVAALSHGAQRLGTWAHVGQVRLTCHAAVGGRVCRVKSIESIPTAEHRLDFICGERQ